MTFNLLYVLIFVVPCYAGSGQPTGGGFAERGPLAVQPPTLIPHCSESLRRISNTDLVIDADMFVPRSPSRGLNDGSTIFASNLTNTLAAKGKAETILKELNDNPGTTLFLTSEELSDPEVVKALLTEMARPLGSYLFKTQTLVGGRLKSRERYTRISVDPDNYIWITSERFPQSDLISITSVPSDYATGLLPPNRAIAERILQKLNGLNSSTDVTDSLIDLSDLSAGALNLWEAHQLVNNLSPEGKLLAVDKDGNTYIGSMKAGKSILPDLQLSFKNHPLPLSDTIKLIYLPPRIANQVERILDLQLDYSPEIAKNVYHQTVSSIKKLHEFKNLSLWRTWQFIDKSGRLDTIFQMSDGRIELLSESQSKNSSHKPDLDLFSVKSKLVPKWLIRLSTSNDSIDLSPVLEHCALKSAPSDFAHLGLRMNLTTGEIELDTNANGILPILKTFAERSIPTKLSAEYLRDVYESIFPDSSSPSETQLLAYAQELNQFPRHPALSQMHLLNALSGASRIPIRGNRAFGFVVGQLLAKRESGKFSTLSSSHDYFNLNLNTDLLPSSLWLLVDLVEEPTQKITVQDWVLHWSQESRELPKIASVPRNKTKRIGSKAPGYIAKSITVQGKHLRYSQLPQGVTRTNAPVLYYGEGARMGESTVSSRFKNGRSVDIAADYSLDVHVRQHNDQRKQAGRVVDGELTSRSVFLPTSTSFQTAMSFAKNLLSTTGERQAGIVYLIEPQLSPIIDVNAVYSALNPYLGPAFSQEREVVFIESIPNRQFVAAISVDHNKQIIGMQLNPQFVPLRPEIAAAISKQKVAPVSGLLSANPNDGIPLSFEEALARRAELSLSEVVAIQRNFSTSMITTGETSIFKGAKELEFKTDKNLIGAYRKFQNHQDFSPSDLQTLRKIAFSTFQRGKKLRRPPNFIKNAITTTVISAEIHPEVFKRIQDLGYKINYEGNQQYTITQIPEQIESALENFTIALRRMKSENANPERIAAFAVQQLLIIHPWKNGNGRTARLLGQILYHQLTGLSLVFPAKFHTELEFDLDTLERSLRELKRP